MKMNECINRWVRDKELEKELGLDKGSLIAEETQAAGQNEAEALSLLIAELMKTTRVEGLDMEKGLERFGGEGKAYMDSLRSYVVHTPPLLDSARTVGDLADYAITVHGIKGSSYGIAAQAVGEMAEKLEHAAKEGKLSVIEAENSPFIAAAEQFISDLSIFLDMLEEKMGKPRKAAPDPELLARIRNAAASYDIGILESAMEELEQYSYEDGKLVPWLREQIDKAEIEEIAEKLIFSAQEEVLYVEA
jgi:HPt (histidine-containing phosphotransfer) domain-containing protein